MSPPRLLDTWTLSALDLASVARTLVGLVREFWFLLVPAALGLAAVFLLLPRARRFPPLWGALLCGLALVLAGLWLVRPETALGETILFYAFAAVAVVAGVLLITQSNPVRAALSFALVVLSTCGLFLLQAAPFLMAATVIIYAGAIVVTFLFVIMLAQQAGLADADRRSREPFLSVVAGFVLLASILCVLHRNYGAGRLEALDALDPFFQKAEKAAQAQSVEEISGILGEDYFKEFFDQIRNIPKATKSEDEAKTVLRAMESVELEKTLEEAQNDWTRGSVDLKGKKARFEALARMGQRLRYAYGSVQPPGKNLPLSGNSGLRPNLPVKDIPTDREGKPVMPAANVASLGQSLFTDYLLAVELAGTLLLVAVIGAIAIAGRRGEVLR
jgi:NADH:ubiquinone oxidoreductase subunit 6 (subunit J)